MIREVRRGVLIHPPQAKQIVHTKGRGESLSHLEERVIISWMFLKNCRVEVEPFFLLVVINKKRKML